MIVVNLYVKMMSLTQYCLRPVMRSNNLNKFRRNTGNRTRSDDLAMSDHADTGSILLKNETILRTLAQYCQVPAHNQLNPGTNDYNGWIMLNAQYILQFDMRSKKVIVTEGIN